jgi:hypothetical protein
MIRPIRQHQANRLDVPPMSLTATCISRGLRSILLVSRERIT